MRNNIKEKLKTNQRLKLLVLNSIVHPIKTRPRWWIRLLQPLYLKKGRRSIIYRNVRKDIVPFNSFIIGEKSVIESFSTMNNMVGDIIIGSKSRVGLGNTIIGPVTIGDDVNLAQNITVSGLNHNYQNPDKTIISQGVNTSRITIENDVWIGANSVILAGITIGKHSVIAAGSIVNRNIPPFSIAAGNPVKIIKQYNSQKKEWENVKKISHENSQTNRQE
ncbi:MULTISPECIES: acyltransferase [Butyricimonas]|uniref:acyltransferase n=1 Tax=Butyricimonas TaxID=574697 RepID=UPI001D07B70B|nr:MULTISPECIES: acyltransferase [Butyricimonas]MCB6972382.1 acyltransferase [Butyricimonas synergistica]MCG4519390.1 acyltransferase [Butyricimonas sp. DFI.6.44]